MKYLIVFFCAAVCQAEASTVSDLNKIKPAKGVSVAAVTRALYSAGHGKAVLNQMKVAPEIVQKEREAVDKVADFSDIDFIRVNRKAVFLNLRF